MDFEDLTDEERAALEPCLLAEAWEAVKLRRANYFRQSATKKQLTIMRRLERGATFLEINRGLGVSYAEIGFVAEQIGMRAENCAA